MTADLARLRERLPWIASQMRDSGMYTQATEIESIVPLLTELEGLRTELKHRCVCRFTSGGNLKGELCAYHKRLRNDEAEGLRRDAERYRIIRAQTGAVREPYGRSGCRFVLPSWLTRRHFTNLLKGSVAGHLDDVCDAAKDAK